MSTRETADSHTLRGRAIKSLLEAFVGLVDILTTSVCSVWQAVATVGHSAACSKAAGVLMRMSFQVNAIERTCCTANWLFTALPSC
jgi:hypothetical protein